jgi:hypothetical protein
MPRVLLVGLLQGPVAWLAIAGALSLGLQVAAGVSPAATIGVSLIAGALAWAAIGLLGNALHRWRERRAVMEGLSGSAPRDGRAIVVVGTLEPLAGVLEAPFDGSRCLLYRYEVGFDQGAGRRRSVGTIARGAAMAPCAVATPSGSCRVLAVPDLDADTPSAPREEQVRRFQEYAARTTFTPRDRSADELLAQWADDDGHYRGDVRFGALEGDTSMWIMKQQHVPVGARVCVFGRYSAERRAVVAPIGSPMRMITGGPEAVAATLASQTRFRAVLGAIFGAASAALVWLFASA